MILLTFGTKGEQRFGVRLSPAEAVALRDHLISHFPLTSKALSAPVDPSNPAAAALAVAASYGAGVR